MDQTDSPVMLLVSYVSLFSPLSLSLHYNPSLISSQPTRSQDLHGKYPRKVGRPGDVSVFIQFSIALCLQPKLGISINSSSSWISLLFCSRLFSQTSQKAGGDSTVFQTGTDNPSPACGSTPELGQVDIVSWLSQGKGSQINLMDVKELIPPSLPSLFFLLWFISRRLWSTIGLL